MTRKNVVDHEHAAWVEDSEIYSYNDPVHVLYQRVDEPVAVSYANRVVLFPNWEVAINDLSNSYTPLKHHVVRKSSQRHSRLQFLRAFRRFVPEH